MFETLKPLPPDAILGIMTLFRADPHPGKIDLSVGVYQDEQGRTPVLASVKRAEKAILEKQDSKTYVAIAGNAVLQSRCRGAPLRQGPSGAEGGPHLHRADARRQRRLEHRGPSRRAREAGRAHLRQRPDVAEPPAATEGLGLAARYLSLSTTTRSTASTSSRCWRGSRRRSAGELVLIHGCCHNPCGADLSKEQWQALAQLCERRGLVPFIDIAYQGLAEGLDEDAYGVRLMAERLPEVVVVTSCSKNLGLYRERVGAASVVSANAEAAKLTAANAANVARGIYSMPPDHGAAIVATFSATQRCARSGSRSSRRCARA